MTTLPNIPLVPQPYPTPRTVVRWAQTFIPPLGQEAWWGGRQRVYQLMRMTHEHEFEALPFLDLPSDAHLLDLGANRGQSIDSIYTVLGRGMKITAVEPSLRLAQRLEKRYPDVRVINMAVGNASGQFDLYTPSYRGFRYDGLASCDEFTARDWFRYSIWRYQERHVRVSTERITVAPVDDLRLDPVHFIKIDVQGMELAVLNGAQRTLERYRPIVMIETPGAEIFQFFTRLDYHPRYWVSGHLSTIRPQWPLNVFFLP